MPKLFFTVPVRVRFFLLVLTLLPCVPGALFLLAGWMCEPRPTAPDARAARRAHSLYQAGIVTLGVGAVCGAAVGWKLVRRRDGEQEGAE